MILGFHHTGISTPDLDRLQAFYVDHLGFSVADGGQWEKGREDLDAIVGFDDSVARFVMLWTGNTHLELFEYTNPIPRPADPELRACDHGITHICLDIEDVDAEYERLKAAGVEFTTPPITVFGVRTTYGKDPDGNILEFQEVLDWDAVRIPSSIRYRLATASN
ncbi:MAG: VOC family protein [Rhodococcus sp. (in: high G+C Gram-positive bacteria)]